MSKVSLALLTDELFSGLIIDVLMEYLLTRKLILENPCSSHSAVV